MNYKPFLSVLLVFVVLLGVLRVFRSCRTVKVAEEHSLDLLAALCAPILAHFAPPSVQPTLEAPKMFALGPVGFGGSVSEEEHQFKAILALEPVEAKQKLKSYIQAAIRKR